MKRAVLFDLDGTLVDSVADIAAAMNRVLGRLGLETHSVDAYRHFTGNGAAVLALRASGYRKDLAEGVLNGFLEEYAAHSTVLTAPYPGVPELLDALSQGGISLCVLSNKEDAQTQTVVRHCFGGHVFSLVRGKLPDIPFKPDPAGALAVAHALDLKAADFFYVGDTVTDVLCAKAAGMASVAVSWGYTDREALLDAGPDRLVDRPDEVLRLVFA